MVCCEFNLSSLFTSKMITYQVSMLQLPKLSIKHLFSFYELAEYICRPKEGDCLKSI